MVTLSSARAVPRISLFTAAALALFGAAMHSIAYAVAGPMIASANVTPFMKGAFAVLWFADSIATAAIGLIALMTAVRPQILAPSALRILALLPMSTGVLILAFIGPFYAGFLQMMIGTLMLIGSSYSDRQAAQQ